MRGLLYFMMALLGLGVALWVEIIPLVLPHPSFNVQIEDMGPGGLMMAPLEGAFEPNTKLQGVRRVLENRIHGVESVAVEPDGSGVYLPDKFGYVWKGRFEESSTGVPDVVLEEENPYTYLGPGRPLGVDLDKDGNLIVCDAVNGLIMVENGTRRVVVLANWINDDSSPDAGSKISFADDLDIASDGVIYFSDATDLQMPLVPSADGQGKFYDVLHTAYSDILRAKRAGRLLAYDPRSGKTRVLVKELWFANGVALSADGAFVAVVEMSAVKRHWLKGPKEGRTDILIKNLPGFPDGISRGPDGNFWLALVSAPSPFLPVLPSKILRFVVAWLPEWLKPRVPYWGAVIKISPEGKVLDTLFDVEGGFVSCTTSAREHQGHLFLGNVVGDYISIYPLAGEEAEDVE